MAAGIHTSREQRRQLARDNAKLPKHLTVVPQGDWPLSILSASMPPIAVFRSRSFLVQKYLAPAPAIARLSVLRTTLDGERWRDGITWDELQAIKNELGYFAHTAVEVYPPMRDLVDVANIRHLWGLDGPLPFAWRAGQGAAP
jgi:hypothetical protein